jgi:hypothetical protein
MEMTRYQRFEKKGKVKRLAVGVYLSLTRFDGTRPWLVEVYRHGRDNVSTWHPDRESAMACFRWAVEDDMYPRPERRAA